MPLLHDEDYESLVDKGLEYKEDVPSRFLILKNYPLQKELYTVNLCDVLIVIPVNYNACGNDMFWTYPVLSRIDKKTIPNTNQPGGNDNRHYDNKEFCRWSRHWKNDSSWKPNIDNILTILQRIEWALTTPDANT